MLPIAKAEGESAWVAAPNYCSQPPLARYLLSQLTAYHDDVDPKSVEGDARVRRSDSAPRCAPETPSLETAGA